MRNSLRKLQVKLINPLFLDGVKLPLCVGQRALQVRNVPVLLVYQVSEHGFVLLIAYWSADGSKRYLFPAEFFSFSTHHELL